MSESSSKTSPIVAIAAVSVIVFSAVGIGVMTGIIPSSFSRNQPAAEPAKAPSPVAQAQTAAPPAQPARPAAAPQAVRKPATAAPAPRPVASEPVRTAAARVCAECGTVSAINVIEQAGEGSGLGAVAGGVVGGILGNQVGDGSGRRIATVAGAAGGAYAGHQIEKHVKRTRRWDVTVRMDDGTSRVFSYAAEPAYRAGDKVKVVNGELAANPQ